MSRFALQYQTIDFKGFLILNVLRILHYFKYSETKEHFKAFLALESVFTRIPFGKRMLKRIKTYFYI